MVHGLAFHPTKPILASGAGDKNLILWDLRNDRQLQRWQSARSNPIEPIAFAPDGELVAVGLWVV